jgi:AP-2 complex subunit beta-1
VVKLFIYKSDSDTSKDIVHKVLKWTTEEVDNPDLRDRGFMYWRLLAISPSNAGEVVLAEKPPITTDSDRMDRGSLDQLLLHTGTLGSIYHKNPEVCYQVTRFTFTTMHRFNTFYRRSFVTRNRRPSQIVQL